MSSKVSSVYFLLGPESGQKSSRLKEIRDNLKTRYNNEIEIDRYYPFETLNGEIIDSLSNNSLFALHRLVILSQAETLNASQVNFLSEYIKEPSSSATLIIISTNTSISAKLTNLVPKEFVEIFWELYENQKEMWLSNFFSKNNLTITSEAIDLLLALVENNTQELRLISSQLIQFIKTQEIDVVNGEIIERYISHSRQESVFSLFEQIALGSLERSLSILHTIIKSKEGEAISLIGGLLWQFRRLASIGELYQSGSNWDSAAKGASVMGKDVPLKRKKDIQTYQEAINRYPLKSTYQIIALLGEYDIKLRQMSGDFQLILLEQMVSLIMLNGGKPPQKLESLSFFTDARL
ncbi:MAG: DNA polymerase III subunit delta [Sphaerochaetaceae bacterium]|jgi:DNA polymerase-3 subunit delta|nr:DNA polymerase III subunit delta [Candidatus Cloacimonadota bacterium]